MENSVILTRKKFTADKFLSQVKFTAPSAVKKILSASANSFIANSECASGVLSLSGKVMVEVVYLSDLGTVEKSSGELDFIEKQQSRYTLDNLFVSDRALVENVSWTSSEVIVSVSHDVSVSGIYKYELSNFEDGQEEFVTKKTMVTSHSLVSSADDNFVVAEEIESNIKNMQVLFSKANVEISDIRSGVDKVIIEGKINTEVFESDGEAFGLVTKEFEFKQEIQADGVTPNMLVEAKVLVKNTTVTPEISEEKTTLVYAIDLFSKCYVFEENSYEVVSDMFSLKNDLVTTNDYVESKTYHSVSHYSENFMTSTDVSTLENFDDLLGVYDASFECDSIVQNGTNFQIQGKIHANALIQVEGGVNKLSIESDIVFENNMEAGLLIGDVTSSVEIGSFKVKAGKELEVNFKLNLAVTNESEFTLTFVKSYEKKDEKQEAIAGVKVYVAEANETLFDVARALNVRPEVISKQNEVSDVFEKGEKIYIYSPINLI